MKTSKQQEIENFVNNLEQSYLSNHQMMTLAVNPESVMGGDLSASKNKKCTKYKSIILTLIKILVFLSE